MPHLDSCFYDRHNREKVNHEWSLKVYALVTQDTYAYILLAQQITWQSLNSKGSVQKAENREIFSEQE